MTWTDQGAHVVIGYNSFVAVSWPTDAADVAGAALLVQSMEGLVKIVHRFKRRSAMTICDRKSRTKVINGSECQPPADRGHWFGDAQLLREAELKGMVGPNAASVSTMDEIQLASALHNRGQ